MSDIIKDENSEIVDEYSNVDLDEELDPHDNNEDDVIDYDETAEESY